MFIMNIEIYMGTMFNGHPDTYVCSNNNRYFANLLLKLISEPN